MDRRALLLFWCLPALRCMARGATGLRGLGAFRRNLMLRAEFMPEV